MTEQPQPTFPPPGAAPVLRVGVLGSGTVGTQVVRLLLEQADDFAARSGARMEITGIAVRNLDAPRDLAVPRELLTDDATAVATGNDLVVELIGGIEPARTLILAAFKAGASVITGNKALIAAHGPELYDAAAAAGHGISGRMDGRVVHAGSLTWLESLGVRCRDESADAADMAAPEGADGSHGLAATAAAAPSEAGASLVGVSLDGRLLGIFAVRDTLRTETPEAVAELKDLGLRPILVTGDNEATARAIAAQAGVDDVRAGVLPEGKLAVVEGLHAEGRTVAMVGDGVNDAAALAGADLSIAMGSGTDVAKAASDVTIVNSDVRTIGAALRISARTLRIIKENLVWAFGYNVIAIPLAVFGVIVPGLAAAAMASSSVIVVGNSLRLRKA